MRRPPKNRSRAFFVTYWAVSLLLGGLVGQWLSRQWSVPSEPAEHRQLPRDVRIFSTAQVETERAWIAETLPSAWFIAAPSSRPCFSGLSRAVQAAHRPVEGALRRQDVGGAIEDLRPLCDRSPDDWLPNLTLAALLAEANRTAEADEALDRWLGSTTIGEIHANIAEAARKQEARPNVPAEVAAALLHAHFLSGTVKLQLGQSERAIMPLRRAIAASKFIASAQTGPRARGWVDAARPAPGCGPGSLTSRELYNNLTVAYLTTERFVESEPGRLEQEATRTETNTIFAALMRDRYRRASRPPEPSDARQVWALSNVDQAIADSLGPPFGPYLSGTAALLLEDEWEHLPRDLRRDAETQLDGLTQAAAGNEEVGTRDRVPSALVRLKLFRASRQRTIAAFEGLEDASSADASKVLRALRHSIGTRPQLSQWLDGGIPAEAMVKARYAMGAEWAERWSKAVRRDFAATLAVLAERDGKPDPDLVRRARGWLAKGDAAPTELLRAEESLGTESPFASFMRTVSPHLWLLGLLGGAGVVAWGVRVGRRVEAELDRRRALFKSFYRAEVDYLARSRKAPKS